MPRLTSEGKYGRLDEKTGFRTFDVPCYRLSTNSASFIIDRQRDPGLEIG